MKYYHRIRRSLPLVAALVALLGLAAACSSPFLDSAASPSALESRSLAPGSTESPLVFPLLAGKTIDAGTLSVWRDESSLYLQYATNASYLIAETHLWIGAERSAVPQNKQGIVVPGRFPSAASYSPAARTALVTVPISWAEGTTLYVFAHAALVGATSGDAGQTAFAGPSVYDSKRWTYYASFALPALPRERSLSGTLFFDANGDGRKGADEPGIPGVSVSVEGETALSDADGAYSFSKLPAALVSVSSAAVVGLLRTTGSPLTVDLRAADAAGVDFGYGLDMNWIEGQSVGGFTIGFWKNNLDKAVAGKTNGVQVGAATLAAYVAELSTFALPPLDPPSLQAASDFMSYNGPDPASLLAKQLMASEFNYVNGALFGGSDLVTSLFVYRGEYLLLHASEYGASELLAAKDLYDAYNNSHGGTMAAFLAP